MKKIAVIASGEAKSAERLATLFNEGNRIRVVAVVTDGEPDLLREHLKGCDVEVIGITPESTADEIVAIGERLLSENPDLIALDGYSGMLVEWLHEREPHKMVRLTDSQQAPCEVVDALENNEKAVQEKVVPSADQPKTVDEEWAETLQIDFHTPPPIPNQPAQPDPSEQPGQPVQPGMEGMPGQQAPYPGMQAPFPGQQAPYPGQQAPQGMYGMNSGQPSGMSGRGYAMRPPQPHEPMPPTYLIWSVIMTVLCCIVPGIVAIFYSSQVSSKYYAGDIEGAKRCSRTAEIWIIVSFVLGVLSATLYIPITFIS